MRLALALFAVLLLAGCIAVDSTREVVTAPPAPTPPILNAPDAAGKVTVLESQAASSFSRVTFGYENSTELTLKRVTVRCRGFDKDGFQTAVQDVTIDGSAEGPIVPGFKIRKQLSLSASGIENVTCVVYRAEAP
jgi:hypothetical protein